ncbi:protein FAM184B isoform X1 [Alosa sapidissima]|uniref:protein FAM184B isoform X1 n=1 Tax=Alosa sapidissima TaxID=34773 RepID=UPI001C08EA8D|nr:protein FAM184B isoform X1 [Alosa sapidissima]
MASSSGKSTNQPTGACNGTAADFTNVEQELYDYQMHTKMCKKIAQLTKVIYSLNTKNEEQEATLQSLRRIATETGQGSLQPAAEGEEGEEFVLRTRLLELQAFVEEEQRKGEQTQAEFEIFRLQVEERDQRSQEEHAERVALLTQEALELRRDLEARVQSLEEERGRAHEQLEQAREESRALAQQYQELRREHEEDRRREEDEERRRTAEEEGKLAAEESERRARALADELRQLREERQGWEEERRKAEEEWERRLREVREAHEKEQAATKRSLQQNLSEQISQWQQKEQENRKSQHAVLQQRLRKIEGELEINEQRLNESKRHCQKLQDKIEDMEEQLEEGRHRVLESEAGAKKAEEELAVAKERLLLQENELQKKSDELMSQSSSQVKVSAEVEELRSQLSRLNLRNKELELQSNGRSSDHARMLKQHADTLATMRLELQRAHAEEVQRLRQEVEQEKEQGREEVEEEKRGVHQHMEEERRRLREQLKRALEEVIRKHTAEMRQASASLDAEKKRGQQELLSQAEELRKRGEEERRSLEVERDELKARLQLSISEISRLEEVIRQKERERELELERERQSREAANQRPVCGVECAVLREQLEQAHTALEQMQVDVEEQRSRLQGKVVALQAERETLEQRLLEQSQQNLEEKIRVQYEQRFAEKHRSAVCELQRERETEIREITQRWQSRVEELQTQLEERRRDSGPSESSREACAGEGEMDRMKQEIQKTRELNSTLRAQLHNTIQEKERLMRRQQLKVVKEEDEDEDAEEGVRGGEGKDTGERDAERVDEALRAERHSHQLTVAALEARAQEDLQAERQRLHTQAKLQLEKQKAELTQQHTEWVRQVTQRHMQQIEDLQAELRTHTEMVALQQDLKQQNQQQSYERQLDESRSEVQELRRDNGELKERLGALLEERERERERERDRERRDASSAEDHRYSSSWEEQERGKEGKEEREKRRQDVDSMKRDHRREIQTLIAAQTRLQARIIALETELREREERTRRREPRLEDLHNISKLQDKLAERDQLIKRLVEERHQLSQHPPVGDGTPKHYDSKTHVGSLTPTLKKVVLEETPPRVTSVPNLSAYERGYLTPDAGTSMSPQTARSPSFEHSSRGLPLSRTSTPNSGSTLSPNPSPGQRHGRSPPQELPHQHPTYTHTRTPTEKRVIETVPPDGQDPQRQEWFTKYFSF